MSTMTLDNRKVETTVTTMEQAEKIIISGSDEHLDIIIDLSKNLSECVHALNELVDSIEVGFNEYSPEMADQTILKVFPILSMGKKITSDLQAKGFYDQLTMCMANFEAALNDLIEIATDLASHKSTNAGPDEDYF